MDRRAVLTSRRGSSMSGCLHVRVSTAWWPACELSPRFVWSFEKIKHQSIRLYMKVFAHVKGRFNSALLPPHLLFFIIIIFFYFLLSLTLICFGRELASVSHSSPLSWQHCTGVADIRLCTFMWFLWFLLSSCKAMATVRKKVDNRIRVQIDNGVALQHRTMFVVVGDRGRDQVMSKRSASVAAGWF